MNRSKLLVAAFVLAACGSSHATSGFAVPTDDAGAVDSGSGGPGDAGGGPTFGGDGGGGDGATTSDADVHAVVTCDNAYGFGWGSATALASYFTAPASVLASDIFNCPIGNGPEAYEIPAAQAPASAYLYAVAWADHSTTQGFIGQFKRVGAAPLYSGDAAWQVCATGIDYDSSNPAQQAGPPLAQINDQIAKCDAGALDPATSSVGWVDAKGAVTTGAVGKLVVGEDNSTSTGDFPIVCQGDTLPDGGVEEGIDAQAHWMWYSTTGAGDPFVFTTTDVERPFLIFRLPASSLPPPPK